LIIVGALRKLIWVFEFWNEMLVSNIRCKICGKESSSFRAFLLEFEKRGVRNLWPVTSFLTIYLRFYDLWVVFKGLRVFETKFSFKRTQLSQFWYHGMFVFSESCLSQGTLQNCRKLIVFSCLQFADYYIWPRILSCGVIFVRLSLLRKSFTLKSFL